MLRWPKVSSKWLTLLFAAAAAFVYFIRASEYILQPQLYAEDGAVWLADAYNLGLKTMAIPYNAFFHTTERLTGYVVAQLPLQYAPLIFNLLAWAIFTIFVFYLFSPRTKILSNAYQQIFVLLSICLIANVDEFFFNFSNSVFLLGLIGLLIAISDESKNIYTNIFEKFIFALSCLTIIFAWVYLPLLLIEKIKHKRNVNFYLYSAIAGSVIQAIAYLLPHMERSTVAVRALLSKFIVLEVYNQIIVPAVVFARVDILPDMYGHYEVTLTALIAILALLGFVYIYKTGNKQVQYLLFFVVVMTAASLKNPLVDSTDPLKFMSVARWGDRYFIFGIIGLSIIFSKLSFQAFGTTARYWFLLIFITFGLVTSLYSRSFFIDKNFLNYRQQYLEGISQLKMGASRVSIPVNPPPIQMVLDRK